MGGHLFTVRGDLRRLACDAILVPSGIHPQQDQGDATGRRGHVREGWYKTVGSVTREGYVEAVPQTNAWRVHLVRHGSCPDPAIWIGHTGDLSHEPADDAAVLVEFARKAGQRVREAIKAQNSERAFRPLADERPLVGVPIVGIRHGGRREHKGEVIKATVEGLMDVVASEDVDVVVVAREVATYAAVQQARGRAVSHADVDPLLLGAAERLAEFASSDELVLFIGAGASMGAGLPSWSELLDGLINEVGLSNELDGDTRRELDSRDVATVKKRRFEASGREMSDKVISLIEERLSVGPIGARSSLTHLQLASLPIREAITTNYDQLFEFAREDADRKVSVLPAESASRPWLLKLHGCLTTPREIVLAREDYLRLENQGLALAGLVQAMLLTRHLLFVGYSLNDDNFHRMVHQVQSVATTRDLNPGEIGTVLTPNPPHVLDQIWKPTVEFVSTAENGHTSPRRQAILLDQLARLTAPVGSHLLDPSYRAVFTGDEAKLVRAMRLLRQRAQAAGVRPAIQEEIEALISRFDSVDERK